MKRFTALFSALDRTNSTSAKVASIEQYFREAPAEDAAWGLFFLSGQRLRGVVKTGIMRAATLRAAGVSEWMLSECYEAVGDLSETIALLLPQPLSDLDEPLHLVVKRRIQPLVRADAAGARDMLTEAWSLMSRDERFVFNKLVRGNFRLGVQRALVVRGLSSALGIDTASLTHRLAGGFDPTRAAFLALGDPGTEFTASRPFPFCLAHQLDRDPTDLGDIREWQIENKWDGIRAQIVRRDAGTSNVVLWSRGEEVITHQFPEIAAAAHALPTGTVLDGEVLAWRFDPSTSLGGRPLSFNALQSRLNRKNVQPTLFDTEGVVFAAFDLLEQEGRDLRSTPLAARRSALEALVSHLRPCAPHLFVSPLFTCNTWAEARVARVAAREEFNAEGLMLKHLGSHYHVSRIAGGTASSVAADSGAKAGWWKWKLDPYKVDAVLIYAQQGSGKRAGLFTDFTFGIWNPDSSGQLIAFAKAYSGLDNEEIQRVDSFIRRNTLDRKGPVSMVRPELVFEIAFESIRESSRHKSGIAVRFPRIARWRTDKTAKDADTMQVVRALLSQVKTRDIGFTSTPTSRHASDS